MPKGEIIMPKGARAGLWGLDLARPDHARASAPARSGALIVLLAAMPCLDVVLAQVHALLGPRIGPLSLPQACHGAVLTILAIALCMRLGRFPSNQRHVLLAAGWFVAALAASTAMHANNRRLTLEDVVAVIQVTYWLVLWPTAFAVCRSRADCRRVLMGIACAGLYAALSVIGFYFAVGQAASPYEDVAASAGGLQTAKGLTGILITGGLAAAWIWRRSNRTVGVIAVALCLSGLFMTYQRAGLVAMLVAMGWLTFWYASRGRRRADSIWVRRLLVTAAAGLLAILAVIGTSDLRKRWQDLPDPAKAGSARVTFWQVVTHHYGSLTTTEKAFGIGYTALVEAMEDQHGARIHTHNDVLDVLAIFGIVGLVVWIGFHAAVIRSIWRSRGAPPVFAVSLAVYLVMLSEGLLTGQMFGPSVMGVYLVGLACWCRLADRGAAAARLDGSPPADRGPRAPRRGSAAGRAEA